MTHGYDGQRVGAVQVSDGEWKAAKHEPSGAVQVLGPALGRLHNVADCIGYRYTKFRSNDWASTAVPFGCVPEIFPRPWVKAELPTSHQGIH